MALSVQDNTTELNIELYCTPDYRHMPTYSTHRQK